MFGISFGEIALIVMIGLIVIGPQRMPETARFLGHMLSRLQRHVHAVKTDIRREMDLEDLKNIQRDYQDAAREVEDTVRTHASDIQQDTAFVHDKPAANNTSDGNHVSDAESDPAAVRAAHASPTNNPASVWPSPAGTDDDVTKDAAPPDESAQPTDKA